MKKIIFIRTIFSFFPLCSKKEKLGKWDTYRLIFHNSILTRKMKKWSIFLTIFFFFYFFPYFKICKYDKDNQYVLFPFWLEKWKNRLAEVCTDPIKITTGKKPFTIWHIR